MTRADFIVVGAGIAGAGIAYELARHASVIVLEGEPQPGYHSTGRSAALFSAIYGNEVVRALSRASRDFLHTPPRGFAANSLLKPRGALFVSHASELDAFHALFGAPDVALHTREMSREEVMSRVPIMKPDWVARAFIEEGAHDVDVHALHQGFLRGLKERGSTLVCASFAQSIVRHSEEWKLVAGGQEFLAPVLINAAGAWADDVARLAGVATIGLEPRRRTAVLIDAPEGVAIDAWPMVIDVGEGFYFKPDAGRLLLSPADETPSPPTDAQPEELDVAIAVDRVEQATTLSIRHVRHRWAGLRSFVPDRSPVAGFDPDAPGFFWLAAQGGYGIQTGPALSRLAAALARSSTPSDPLLEACIPSISPKRLR